jgi:hypothetical protein
MRPALVRHPGCHEGMNGAAELTDTEAGVRAGPDVNPASAPSAAHAPSAASGPVGSGGTPEQYYGQVVERITALAGEGCNAPAITRLLQREGYTMAPGRSDPISLTTVRRMLRENVQPVRRRSAAEPGESLAADEWWLRDLAVELVMPSITLYGWVRRGWVTVARKESRPPYRLILRADRAEVDRLRAKRPRAEEQPGAGNGPLELRR